MSRLQNLAVSWACCHCLYNSSRVVPKAEFSPHQDSAHYTRRAVIRFANKDETTNVSILFGSGKPGAGNINKQVLSVALESNGYYVADEDILEQGFEHDGEPG